jgi:hypothetical protein
VSKRAPPLVQSVGREGLPSHGAVHSRATALADPQGSLNSVPLGPLSLLEEGDLAALLPLEHPVREDLGARGPGVQPKVLL